MSDYPDLDAKFAKDKMQLILDAPFFGVLLSRLPVIPAELTPCGTPVSTACTDGKTIYFNPDFADSLSAPERRGVLAHEVMHPALGHLWRIGGRDPDRFNIACDLPINHTLTDYIQHRKENGKRCGIALPPNVLLHQEWKDLSAEHIYTLLPPNPPNTGSYGKGNGNASSLGEFIRPPKPDQGEGEGEGQGEGQGQGDIDIETSWKLAATQAAVAEKQSTQGKLPGFLQRLINEFQDPAVQWIDILRSFAATFARNDYSYARPNRRYGGGFILPSLYSEALGEIVVVIDTSGSIDLELLTTFLSEIQSILDTCNPEKLHIIDCDSSIHRHDTFTAGDDLRSYRPTGGGGTSFIPPFLHLAEQGIAPAALIYFTDLWGNFPDEPDYPTLWLAYGTTREAPFGQTIHVS